MWPYPLPDPPRLQGERKSLLERQQHVHHLLAAARLVHVGFAINAAVSLIPKGSSIHALYPCSAGGANAAGVFGSEQHQLSRAIGV